MYFWKPPVNSAIVGLKTGHLLLLDIWILWILLFNVGYSVIFFDETESEFEPFDL